MSFAFKKFNFFQQTDISTGDTGRNGTCYVASSSYLYVGCDNGSIQALNERAQVVFSFSAHGSRVFHAVWIEVRLLGVQTTDRAQKASVDIPSWYLI